MIQPGQYVLAGGRYFGTVRQSVAVQNEHGYSVAYLVQYQREVEPSRGWFLARDVQPAYWLSGISSAFRTIKENVRRSMSDTARQVLDSKLV